MQFYDNIEAMKVITLKMNLASLQRDITPRSQNGYHQNTINAGEGVERREPSLLVGM